MQSTKTKSLIAASAQIAPTAIIGDNVSIGENTIVSDYVVIRDNVSIGAGCKFHPHCVIGEEAQDIAFKGETSFIKIGDNNTFREFTTVHKAVGEGEVTSVGDNNFLMCYSHVGHNCKVGNNITFANSVHLGGYVTVEDHVVFGGSVAIHQGCKIGEFAMFGGMSATSKDIPPYFMYLGSPAACIGINRLGLKRSGIDPQNINEIFKAFKLIYRSKLSLRSAIEQIGSELEQHNEIVHLIDFLKNTKRGIKVTGN